MLIDSNDIKIISHFGAIILQTEITKRQLILIRLYFISSNRGSYLIKFNNTIPQKDHNKLFRKPWKSVTRTH